MKHYVYIEVTAIDDSWIPSYIEGVTKLVQQAGGTYLARTPNCDKLEGKNAKPEVCALIEFPSKETATAFYKSAEYAPYLKQRQAGAKSELMLFAGEDYFAT